MPSLVNKNKTEAEKLLRDRNLVPQGTGVQGSDCQLNIVLRQGTVASTKVDVGTRVTFEWCAGPGQTKVPAVLGLDAANALSALHDAKLTAKTVRGGQRKAQGRRG